MVRWWRSGFAVAAACVVSSCTGWQSALNAQGSQSLEIRRLLLIFTAVAVVVWLSVMLVLLFGLVRRKRRGVEPLDLHQGFERAAGSVILVCGLLTVATVLVLS